MVASAYVSARPAVDDVVVRVDAETAAALEALALGVALTRLSATGAARTSACAAMAG
jgi:hypothetical protein